MFVIFAKSGLQPAFMVLPTIYYELLRLLFNNVDSDSLLLYLLHSSSSHCSLHLSPSL